MAMRVQLARSGVRRAEEGEAVARSRWRGAAKVINHKIDMMCSCPCTLPGQAPTDTGVAALLT